MPKLRGLADFAEKYGHEFRRIESVAETGGVLRVLDITKSYVREAIRDGVDGFILPEDGCEDAFVRLVLDLDRDRARLRAVSAGAVASGSRDWADAAAPLLAFLDADDWWQPGKLAAVVAAFGRAPDAGLVYHRLQPTHLDGSKAFAAIPLKLLRDMGWSQEQTNVNGGAIAMGHPLGATGAMILGTLVDELERRDLRTGIATLCIGAGMGVATIVERV